MDGSQNFLYRCMTSIPESTQNYIKPKYRHQRGNLRSLNYLANDMKLIAAECTTATTAAANNIHKQYYFFSLL